MRSRPDTECWRGPARILPRNRWTPSAASLDLPRPGPSRTRLVLAEAGLLDGKRAALHHGSYNGFAAKYPKVQVKRGVRFVDAGNIATAGGLTSGIDLALHVVARLHGKEVAANTADVMEHDSVSWQNPETVKDARWLRSSALPGSPADLVCGMDVRPGTKITAVHQGKTYYFCSEHCKRTFSASPAQYAR